MEFKEFVKETVVRTERMSKSVCSAIIKTYRQLSESKAGNFVRNSTQKFGTTVKGAATKAKEIGVLAAAGATAAEIVSTIREKIHNANDRFANKHPKLAKVLKKILKIGSIGICAFLAVKVLIAMIAIFPEVLSLVLMLIAAFICLDIIFGIFSRAIA